MGGFRLIQGQLVMPNGQLTDGTLDVVDSQIAGVCEEAGDLDEIDVSSLIVAPGFVDIHLNGGMGESFEDADAEGLSRILDLYVKHGTTSLLGTINTAPREERLKSLSRIQSWRDHLVHPVDFLGVYMEGPYYNPEQRGAHREDWMRDPDPAEYGEWIDRFGDLIRVVSLAPERLGAMACIRALDRAGIIPAVGHSMASDAVMVEAIEAGVRLVTHLYNAQSTFYRGDDGKHLGIAEMGLLRDELTVEVIPDGYHLTPMMLSLVLKAKAHHLICATTDAMHATGLGAGQYELFGQTVWVDGDEAFREDRTRHAGSILTMEKGVQVLVNAGASVETAIQMATEVPARVVGVDDRKGKLVKGYDADLVLLNGDLNVVATICRGEVVYQSDESPFKACEM
ncbi:MAG: N-acetylglucosamine-6-phosphate deacetylase, partial [Candidatus Latescibacteria bacterium]|nr:N-acetylglucosamine-6-phosphate deacetylase [Candidatus Latescibacterota bacterium]